MLQIDNWPPLRKQARWVDEAVTFHHYRDKDKVEVDIVMETASVVATGSR